MRPQRLPRRPPTMSLPELLESRSIPEPNTGCRLWMGSGNAAEYSQVIVSGKMVRVHRLAWELANGRAVPEGLFVRHLCHQPACIEPRHLAAGTQAENFADSERDGRIPEGARTTAAELSAPEVREIVEMVHSGQTYVQVAKKFAIHFTTVGLIWRGLAWTHITGLTPMAWRPRGN